MQTKITWKKIKCLKTFVFLAVIIQCFTLYSLSGQNQITLQISQRTDTAVSSLGHRYFYLEYFVPENDTFITTTPKFNCLELSINGVQWSKNNYEMYNMYSDRIYSKKEYVSVSILDFLLNNPEWLINNTGLPLPITVRLHLAGSLNGVGGQSYYSNIDTLFIPYPDSNEIASFKYLLNTIAIDKNSFCWLRGYDYEAYSEYLMMRDSFPNTVISNMARYMLLRRKYLLFPPSGRLPTLEEKAIVNEECLILKNSKCPYVRKEERYYRKIYFKE